MSARYRQLRWILPLCLIDIGFILIYLAQTPVGWEVLARPQFSIAWDRSFPEVFQYLKFLAAGGLACLLYRQTRGVAYAAIAGTLGLLLLSDGLSGHEKAGLLLVDWLGFEAQWGLRGRDFGEMIAMTLLGGAVAGVLFYAHMKSPPRHRRLLYGWYAVVASLVATGVVADMLHETMATFETRLWMTVVEDGGEMIVGSVLLVMMAHHYQLHQLSGRRSRTLRARGGAAEGAAGGRSCGAVGVVAAGGQRRLGEDDGDGVAEVVAADGAEDGDADPSVGPAVVP